MSRPVWYTFGNHFHWVDMQWLWGYGVLGASIKRHARLHRCHRRPGQPELRRCRLRADGGGGARGARVAAGRGRRRHSGDRRCQLRPAVPAVPPRRVGGAPAAPTGSARSSGCSASGRSASGRRSSPSIPQLPQLLADTGYRYASLFFQWTWHTPHVPVEDAPAIWWEGLDGTRILSTPRGPLNLHQWPEDFAALRAHPLLRRLARAGDPAVAGAAAVAGLDVPLRAAGRRDERAAVHAGVGRPVRHALRGARCRRRTRAGTGVHDGRRLPRDEPGQERRPRAPTQPGDRTGAAVRRVVERARRAAGAAVPALGCLSRVGARGGLAGAAGLPAPRQRRMRRAVRPRRLRRPGARTRAGPRGARPDRGPARRPDHRARRADGAGQPAGLGPDGGGRRSTDRGARPRLDGARRGHVGPAGGRRGDRRHRDAAPRRLRGGRRPAARCGVPGRDARLWTGRTRRTALRTGRRRTPLRADRRDRRRRPGGGPARLAGR